MPRKKLSETFIFSTIKSYFMEKYSKITNPNTSILVNSEMLEEPIMLINRTLKYPNKDAVMQALSNGGLRLYIYKKGAEEQFPLYIPYLIHDNGTASVFLSNYCTFDGKYINMDYKKLYCLLESAYIGSNGINLHNSTLINKGSLIWSHMFTKVLNKKFALNTDRNAMNKVIFLASKYFLYSILGMRDERMIFNYALKNCNSATELAFKDIDAEFSLDTLKDISTFVTKLANVSFKFISGFEKITVRDYIQSFSEMYGIACLFSLEMLEYFVFVISSIVYGAYFNNQTLLEEIIDVDGSRLYFELGR